MFVVGMKFIESIGKRFAEEIPKKVVEYTFLVTTTFLVPFLLKRVPQFKTFFSQAIPLWVTFSVVLTLVGVAILAAVEQRRAHQKALGPVNKAMQTLRDDNTSLKGRL